MKKRLPTHVFDLPVQEIRIGYRSDIYFWREKRTLEHHGLHPSVTMQVFQKKKAVVCGIDEALAVLKVGAGRFKDYKKAHTLFDRILEIKRKSRKYFTNDNSKYLQLLEEKFKISEELNALWESGYQDLKIYTLYDGDSIEPWETVMHITGDASLFAHLETIYLGVLARRTKVATNVYRVVEAAKGKIVLFFPARFDHWAVQGGDGYAAHVGGATGVSTEAQGEWWGAKAAGTVPHALIAAVGGNTVEAVRLFGETYPEVNLVALVDFDNDCVNTALKCADALGDTLWGVRLDTSDNLVDASIIPNMGTFKPTGVVQELVYKTRNALDKEGFNNIKIIVSGGFNPEKINEFESKGVPVDAYGVGSALLQGTYDFTADVVLREGKQCAKVGRRYLANDRLSTMVWD